MESIVIQSFGLRTIPTGFPNYAGQNGIDKALAEELKAAGIPISTMPEILRSKDEVPTITYGWLHTWKFERAWYYWRASGPGLPPQYADALYILFGKECRVAGHCGCPSPLEWYKGFAVGSYHVDTPRALAALATALKACANDASYRAEKQNG